MVIKTLDPDSMNLGPKPIITIPVKINHNSCNNTPTILLLDLLRADKFNFRLHPIRELIIYDLCQDSWNGKFLIYIDTLGQKRNTWCRIFVFDYRFCFITEPEPPGRKNVRISEHAHLWSEQSRTCS
jgi:hypothetical protein